MSKTVTLSKGTLIAILALAIIGVGTVSAIIAFTLKTSPSWTKNQATIAWYSDLAMTTPIGSTMSLGAVDPNTTIQKTVYIYNNGTMTVTLNLVTENYTNSTVQNDVTINWNREGQSLSPGSQVQAIITFAFKDGTYGAGACDLKINAIIA